MNTTFQISPSDSRYAKLTTPLNKITSDFGLNKIRCEIEIEYLIMLLNTLHPAHPLPLLIQRNLREIYTTFSLEDYNQIREIEKTTNHDIKAIEYFIKSRLQPETSLPPPSPPHPPTSHLGVLVHFALTSQDINSVANTLTVKRSLETVLIPSLISVSNKLGRLSIIWGDQKMMSKTHGQPAVTTTMGKELMVFKSRLDIQLSKLRNIKYTSKFGGAVGNLNAHYISYPDKPWDTIMDNFLERTFSIRRNRWTTQIDHYDNLSEVFDILRRINTILIDLNQDMWLYISNEYFKLKQNKNETGSSTMPHKVNPINFENAEGNIHMANALLTTFSQKLPVSRLQRDLTDSTISRNFGSAFSYCLISYTSLLKGLDKITINQKKLKSDLDNNWSILTEAIQCVMKTEHISDAYEQMKEKSRGKHLTQEDYLSIVKELNISEESKTRLLNLTPENYSGNADHIIHSSHQIPPIPLPRQTSY